jgi:DivIVA domain-containing protein
VAPDRQSIERKDFPVSRRGYDTEAVDAHLSAVAAELEELRSTAAGRGGSLAGAASAQVRAIVEAAEATAAEIRAEADEEATRIRTEALGEAQAARSDAAAQAGERVAQVKESAAAMLERIQAIDRELNALLESLRTGATRLSADLKLVQDELSDAREAATPAPDPAAAPVEPPAPARPASDGATEVGDERSIELAEDAAVGLDDAPSPAPAPARAATRTSDDEADLEGARLIALNMALNGTSREEIDRYLAENFDLSNRAALLDEVYASVED